MPDVLCSDAWHRQPAPEVSVAISSYGRATLLPGLLAALEQQHDAPPFEVVIADNGSADGTWNVLTELVAGTASAVCAVRLPVNRGAGAGRNGAVAATRGPVVAFTDDDCLPSRAWLRRLVAPLADPEVALVQGRTEPEPGPAPGPWARSVWVTGPTPWFETCNIAYRRAAYEAAGGFDERNHGFGPGRRAFGEDTVLAHRVLTAGGRPAYAADAVVHHRWHAGTFADHLAERRVLRDFPRLAAEVPGLGLGWSGVFLSRRTAAVDLAVAAVATAAVTRRAAPLLGVLPWLRTAWAPARDRRGPLALRLAQGAVADLTGVGALARGSLEHRRLLL